MAYNYLFPQKIIFENDSISKIGQIIKKVCPDPLILTGGSSLKKSGNYENILSSLTKENINYKEFDGIKAEPTPEIIDEVTEFCVLNNIKSIVAIGGGSVIDTGKAAAGLVTNEKGVENYLEGVGKNFKLVNDPLPFVAVPTTAGSGAEATKNSVVTSKSKKYKKSFRDDRLVAKIIIVDPMLTLTIPKKESAYCGMDAICQLTESYVSKKRSPYTMALSAYYIPRALKAISNIFENPDDISARTTMIEASLASGICLANSGLGAVHGFASGLGGMFDIPHGLICAVSLPGICKINSEKDKLIYKDLANIFNQNNNNDIDRFINSLYELNKKLNIPDNFKAFSISIDDSHEIVARSKGSSMSGNPVEIGDNEWVEFIKRFL